METELKKAEAWDDGNHVATKPSFGLYLCERTNKFCPIEISVVLGFAVNTIKLNMIITNEGEEAGH